MMTAYFRGSSIRIPPIFANSAVTPSTFMELIFSTTAGGNAFSIPKTIPIFLVLTGHSSPRVAAFENTTALSCHSERSEGPRTPRFINYRHQAFSRCSHDAYRATADSQRQTTTKNIFPPSSATKASHAANYPPKHPANLEPPWHSASPTVSRSGPGTYPSRPIPAQSSSAGSGLRTNHHSASAENPEGN